MPQKTKQVQLHLTRLTAPGRITKEISLKDGELHTEGSPLVYAGTGEVQKIPPELEALGEVMGSLTPNQCLLYGLPAGGHERFRLTTESRRSPDDPPDCITRSRANFCWPHDIAVLFLDHDASDGKLWEPSDLAREVTRAVPAFKGQRYLVRPSSSSYLRGPDGKELRGLRGFHMYTIVPASELLAIVKHLRAALAARGHIRFDISKDGKLLERGLFDWSVHQPERIDYVAPPVCKDGIEAFGRGAQYVEG